MCVDGVDIAVSVVGAGPPALVLHGFTGSAAAMATVIDSLARDHLVIAPDLVGHGDSAAPSDLGPYATEAIVRQLLAVIDASVSQTGRPAAGGAAVDLVGYSLGGRLGLSLACAHPDRVRRMALIGTTGGIEDERERDARRESDERLAVMVEHAGVDAFVDMWEALPIFATQRLLAVDVQAAIRAGRLANRAVGLANSLRGCGAGSMPPVWADLDHVGASTLLIAGALDLKYVELGRRLAATMPDARLAVVDDVGHAVHLEAPMECGELLAEHLGD